MYFFLKKNKHNLEKKRGFSLIELMIVVAVLVVISSIGVGSYINYNKSVEMNSFAQTMTFDLKQAQSNSMAGVDGLKWGIHFVSGASDYYEVFSTPTDYSDGSKVIISTNYLPKSIYFSNPTEGNTKDIIFNKISGGITNSSSVIIFSQEVTKTIDVSDIGKISIEESATPISYIITSSVGANGSISPIGSIAVPSGGSQSFTITPDSNYQIGTVTVDGQSVSAISPYTFSNVVASHTISATFSLSNQVPSIIDATSSSVTATTATLGANVFSLGIPESISARGTCWGTLPEPITNCSPEGGTTTGVFTQSRTGFIGGTLYYYRGYATNATGTAYSSDQTFTTSTNPLDRY